MNDGSSLYRARFQWQPTTTAHDPDNILTLEDGVAAQTYTFTGDVALTFSVASDVDFGDTQDAAVALTFAVSSPLAATYAEPVDVALTFAVAATQTATYAEPVAVALTFGVSSPQTATYAEPVSVALAFGVESPFEYIDGSVEEETPSTGGSGGGSGSSGASFPWVRPPRRPVVYEFVGSVAMPKWKVSSWVYGPRYPAHDVMVAAVQWAPEHSPAVIQIPKRSLRVTQMAEEDELLLIGAL